MEQKVVFLPPDVFCAFRVYPLPLPTPIRTHAPSRNKTQKLELQRAAMDCLSTVISRAGPEMTGMLVAHRVPAILCSCLRLRRRQQRSPSDPPDSSRAGGRAPAVRRDFVLAAPAVRALAQLVHPTGPQWRPLRALPFGEAAAAAAAAAAAVNRHRRRQGLRCRAPSPAMPMEEKPSTGAGVAVDVSAAVELGASVWRQTAKHLLEGADNGGGDGGDGGTGSGGGSFRAHSGNLAVAEGEAEASGVNAVAALCAILCEADEGSGRSDAALSSADSGEGGVVGAVAAPFCGQPRRSFEKSGGGGGGGGGGGEDVTRLAALRVLLHACRASPGVAHAIVAFGGGAAVQALTGRLSLPSADDPDVSTLA